MEEETFKNTLIFIKELVNFKGTNVIFLMDEQKVDKHETVDRSYLDKFVNRKFQLSKINYQEIFNHFKKNLAAEHFESDWTQTTVNKVKDNIVIYIKELIKDFETRLAEIQKSIDDLSNKTTSKNQSNDNEQVISLREKLNGEKEKFEKEHQKLNDGITNVRKTKKIIREIKEILKTIDQISLKSENFKKNLSRIDRLEEIVVRVAIFKILFGEQVDKLIQQGDFLIVMKKIKYLQNKNHLLSSFYTTHISSGITEEQGLKMDITNEFCNAIILNHSFDKLRIDKKTVSEDILAKLDNPSINLDIKSVEEIKDYLKVVMFNNYGIKSELVEARRSKLINHIVSLYREEVITIKNLFEILAEPHYTPLLDSNLYLLKLKEIISESTSFQDKKDRTVSLTYLRNVQENIFLNYRNDILMIMSLLKLKDPSYRYENFAADLGEIYSFEEMVKAIKRIFNENDNATSELLFFKTWLNSSIENIVKNNEDNVYILEAVKQYQRRINDFIATYELKEELETRLKSISIEPTNKFNEKLYVDSTDELIIEIKEFHQFICVDKNTMTWQSLRYFSSLLIFLENDTRKTKFEDEIINKVKELYNNIPVVDGYAENSDEKRTWLWCTVKLGQITENLKKNTDVKENKENEEI